MWQYLSGLLGLYLSHSSFKHETFFVNGGGWGTWGNTNNPNNPNNPTCLYNPNNLNNSNNPHNPNKLNNPPDFNNPNHLTVLNRGYLSGSAQSNKFMVANLRFFA